MALDPQPPSRQTDRALAVLLHAFRKMPATLDAVADVVDCRRPDAHVIAPQLPFGMWSFADLGDVSRDVVALIDAQVAHRADQGWPPFAEILLIGHSTGSMVSRKAYVIACGETEDAPFRHADRSTPIALEPGRPWAPLVTRIVQLAGMNGGWSVSHHMGLKRSLEFAVGRFIANVLLTLRQKRLAIDHIRRGSPFLTGLRLEWLAMLRAAAKAGRTPAMVVQLLGTVDDLVSPDDNLDMVTGKDFLYLDVPQTGHVDVVRFDRTEAGLIRRHRFELALTGTKDEIARESVVPVDAADVTAGTNVTDVVFVIHGIRDTGFWTHKIARRVQAAGRDATPPRVFATETSTYGYFPMLSFLVPARRRDKVAWLTDRYVRARAAYPDAAFSYVGHSNGTYLLAKALVDNPAVRFTHVVFAGSVVRRKYDWAVARARKQVVKVLNYVATNDKVVACFPGALERVAWQDLGGAGHQGFLQATAANSGFLNEKRFVEGTHGAALAERHWDDIARFICTGQPPQPLDGSAQGWFVRGLGRVPWAVWIVILGLLVLLAWAIWTIPWEGLRVLALIVFGWVVVKILTRF
jgi:hypothetical protein